MTTTMGGRQVIWAFVEHEHRELLAGIDRMHELADDLATIPADRKSPASARCFSGSRTASSLTWPGRNRGSARRSTTR